MKPSLIPLPAASQHRRVAPGDVAVLACALIVGLMAAYSLTHRDGGSPPAQNAVGTSGGVGSDLLSGSDKPEENEAGAQDEPELTRLREDGARGNGRVPQPPRTPDGGSAPQGR